ncbi:hypothetical protein HUB98_05970 [Paenibacillus barcinonensis]|uniref:Uncharacterized protein n=1 Tax=Paenibacillus barcinonensis TaxID=198119 RepID=A0A2V4W0B2_PAEBA|nr:hypothetical protein [Paenibacillus barcinonensis]PYE51555.1 hypothetical protein DFQ00_102349 [Paenibacillus barcinonensis]QKS55928.1 hypothetical protein HUB98_05970 [Paenibacillus barcinonensis]
MEIVDKRVKAETHAEHGDVLVTELGNYVFITFDENSSTYGFVWIGDGLEIRDWKDNLNNISVGSKIRGMTIVSIIKNKDIEITFKKEVAHGSDV